MCENCVTVDRCLHSVDRCWASIDSAKLKAQREREKDADHELAIAAENFANAISRANAILGNKDLEIAIEYFCDFLGGASDDMETICRIADRCSHSEPGER